MTREEAIEHGKEQLEIFGGEHIEFIKFALEALEKGPIREHGEWIERMERDDYNDYEHIWYECTNCHGDADRPSNFCPNCGADMRGKQK